MQRSNNDKHNIQCLEIHLLIENLFLINLLLQK